ncbi:uncharacterized protein [Miscanthus floridulus]|uniref:uncharacterized protein n=1 Tax=Miscanthus floridulus TaxID=154761 RepID=UPI00345AB801
MDTYIKIESSRLDFMLNNQDTLRVDLYQGLEDSMHSGKGSTENVGRRTVMSSSFIGGPRDMRRRYMDAMALVRKLFATILVFYEPNDVMGLWLKHYDAMSEDYSRSNPSPDLVQQMVLIDIRNMLQSMGKDIRSFPLPDIDHTYDTASHIPREIFEEAHVRLNPKDVLLCDSLNAEQRNIDPANGLCNGTRLLVQGFRRNTIDAEIVVGQHAGKRFKRKQFPIRLSFAMTVNKSQGQTIPNVGVYLPAPVFSHGQLYVAMSRAMSRVNIKILVLPPDADAQEEEAKKIEKKNAKKNAEGKN